MKNTILAGNTADVDLDAGGQITSLGHNLVGVSSGTNGLDTSDTDRVGGPSTPIDPLLGPLQDNGGPTFTHALLPGSPAIDTGDGSAAPVTDQRGFPRIDNGTIDIGSFELQTTPRGLLEGVLVQLTDERTEQTRRGDLEKLDQTMDRLGSSLDSRLWIDQKHLTPKAGVKVFNDGKDAVGKLLDVLEQRSSSMSKLQIQDSVEQIVTAFRLLATIGIADADTMRVNDDQLSRARQQLVQGENAVAHGQYEVAMDRFREAWLYASTPHGPD
jgi:hypothetical protein